jgi:hypothetical protein
MERTGWVASNVFLVPRVVPEETAALIYAGYRQFFSRRTMTFSYHFHLVHVQTMFDDRPKKLASLRFPLISAAIQQCLVNKCSNPRDKVYGVYNLMPPCFVSELPAIDYEIDPRVLYEYFTRAIIRITGIFWPAVTVPDLQTNLDLPSWVPNLGFNIDNFKADDDQGEDGPIWVTDRISSLVYTSDSNRVETVPETQPGAFALKGTLISHIEALADQRWPTQAKDRANCFWSWFKFAWNALEAYDNSDPEIEGHNAGRAGWAGLLMDELGEEEKKEAISLVPAMMRWVGRRASLDIDNQSPSARFNDFINRGVESEVGDVHRYIHITGAKFQRQATLFTTVAGHLGYGFGQILQHDAIVLLTGYDDAVVLRPQGENWQLVGRAHVNGIELGPLWREKVRISEMQSFKLI